MAKPIVYLVGAGPGSPDLITLRGLRLVKRADVILYDHLIGPELLRLAPPDAEMIPVGKSAASHTMPQSQINDLLIHKAKTGKLVVRLKGGDPCLFGRGGEEALACADAGVDFEIVPGVTSAIAAPACAGIPITHRDFTSDVAIITGHRRDDAPIKIPRAGTVVLLMSVENLDTIVRTFIEDDWPPDTPIAAIERGACYDQRVIIGDLANFSEKAARAKLKPPAVIVVGKVVELHDKLDWFSKRPNVLILGSHPERYRQLGNIVHRPIIDCVHLDDYTHADGVLRDARRFDWLIFTSVNGAKYFFDRLFALDLDARALASAQVAAIGKTTAARLRELGVKADMIPPVESSAGLLDQFRKLDIAGRQVLLPRAQDSSEELALGLKNMGAVVQEVALYKTVDIDPGDINFDFIDNILFTSASTVRAFVKRFGAVPPGIEAFCLGPPTLAEAGKYNIKAQLLPGSPSVKENQ